MFFIVCLLILVLCMGGNRLLDILGTMLWAAFFILIILVILVVVFFRSIGIF